MKLPDLALWLILNDSIVIFRIGAIAVIHGENNVGKSNLLEAMPLFFQLLLVQESNQTVHKTLENARHFLVFWIKLIINLLIVWLWDKVCSPVRHVSNVSRNNGIKCFVCYCKARFATAAFKSMALS